MPEPSVDIELQDMATGMGMSLRRLMAGVLNGRCSEHVTEDDLVRGDKGDPLFFRIDQSRAYSIFGTRLNEVSKDMGTVEEMSTSEDETSKEASFSVDPETVATTPRENEGEDTSTGFSAGQVAAIAGGVGLFVWALSSSSQGRERNRGLSGLQRQQIRQDGYRGYFEGVRYNPYRPETEAGRLYQEGWDEARRRVATGAGQQTRLA